MTPNVDDENSNRDSRFTSSSKDTGFILDFGNSNPFDHQGAVMGGADRPVTVTAKHPGCYTYSVGTCTAGTVYGMCGEDVTQLIISDKQRSAKPRR